MTAGNESSAALVNVSGRQRLLSQQVVLLAEHLAEDIRPAARQANREELRRSIKLMKRSHDALVQGNAGGKVAVKAEKTAVGCLILTVADSGVGMSEKDIVKALEPFGQVDSSPSRRYQGTGLGLPLLKGLVELHGGMLEIASEVGAGTEVSVTFPSERTVR